MTPDQTARRSVADVRCCQVTHGAMMSYLPGSLRWHARGQGFKSPQLHSHSNRRSTGLRFFIPWPPLASRFAPFVHFRQQTGSSGAGRSSTITTSMCSGASHLRWLRLLRVCCPISCLQSSRPTKAPPAGLRVGSVVHQPCSLPSSVTAADRERPAFCTDTTGRSGRGRRVLTRLVGLRGRHQFRCRVRPASDDHLPRWQECRMASRPPWGKKPVRTLRLG
jgi:hypothetical protein